MKRFMIFLCLIVTAAILWYVSIPYVISLFGEPNSLSEAGDMFGGVSALFSALGLAGIVYAVWLQTIELQETQKNIERSLKVTQTSAELTALAALVQEANNALERYERWETNGTTSDYTQVKAKVRENVNKYRLEIESRLKEVNS